MKFTERFDHFLNRSWCVGGSLRFGFPALPRGPITVVRFGGDVLDGFMLKLQGAGFAMAAVKGEQQERIVHNPYIEIGAAGGI